MLRKTKQFMMALVAVGAIAVGSAVIANAASSGEATAGGAVVAEGGATGQQGGPRPGGPGPGETPLTGEIADKVTAAAKEKVPGGTVLRVETDAGPAAYEAHVRKSDGTEVVVLVNKDFEVTAVQAAGPGGRGGRPCDRDHDGDRGSDDSGSDSSGNQGTSYGDPYSSSQT